MAENQTHISSPYVRYEAQRTNDRKRAVGTNQVVRDGVIEEPTDSNVRNEVSLVHGEESGI